LTQADVDLFQRQIIIAEFQALSIYAVPLAHRRTASARRKVSITSVYQVVPVLDELILAAHAAAAVRLIDAGRDLGSVAGQSANLLAISSAGLLRKLRSRLEAFAGLDAVRAELDGLQSGQSRGDRLDALRVSHAVGVATRMHHPLRFRG